jgi:thioredoxin 1
MKKLFWVLVALFAVVVTPSLSAANPDSAADSKVLKVTNDNYEALAAKHKLLIVDFWAQWCPPCRALTPVIEELAAEYVGKVAIGKCNVDENKELTRQFKVSSIPALFFIKNGKIVDTHLGYCEKDVLKEKIEKFRK